MQSIVGWHVFGLSILFIFIEVKCSISRSWKVFSSKHISSQFERFTVLFGHHRNNLTNLNALPCSIEKRARSVWAQRILALRFEPKTMALTPLLGFVRFYSHPLLFVRWCWQCTHQRGDCEHKVEVCHCGSVLWWVIINKVVSWVEACGLTSMSVQHVSWLLMCRCLEVVVDGEGECHVGSCW
jgi:hypothetical protein